MKHIQKFEGFKDWFSSKKNVQEDIDNQYSIEAIVELIVDFFEEKNIYPSSDNKKIENNHDKIEYLICGNYPTDIGDHAGGSMLRTLITISLTKKIIDAAKDTIKIEISNSTEPYAYQWLSATYIDEDQKQIIDDLINLLNEKVSPKYQISTSGDNRYKAIKIYI